MADYTAKRISELQEASNITDRDLLVINEFSNELGYTLTKKVQAGRLAEYVRLRSNNGLLASLDLSDLAHYDTLKLLDKLVYEHNSLNRSLSSLSLALSVVEDLDLGELAHLDKDMLQLDKYVEKAYATTSWSATDRQYMTGINQQNGKIASVTFGNLDEKLPVDKAISSESNNAIANSVVTSELNKKVDKSIATVEYLPTSGQYIDGLTQKDGKIVSIHKENLPKQTIDSTLNVNSKNPVENKAIVAKLTSLESSIRSDSNATYVKKSDANATYSAVGKQYVSGIQQTNGRVSKVLFETLPDQLAVDSEMSTTSTNPVQNKVITAAINSLKVPLQSVLDTLGLIYPVGSIYLTTAKTCPLQDYGIGTWQRVANGRCLWGSNGSNAGTTIEAGLPNITGDFTADNTLIGTSIEGASRGPNGVFYGVHTSGFDIWSGGSGNGGRLYFDASRSSSIYGKSTTVQPPAFVVNVFRRIK